METGFLEFGLSALVAFWYVVMVWALVILSEAPPVESGRSAARASWVKSERKRRVEVDSGVQVGAIDREAPAA